METKTRHDDDETKVNYHTYLWRRTHCIIVVRRHTHYKKERHHDDGGTYVGSQNVRVILSLSLSLLCARVSCRRGGEGFLGSSNIHEEKREKRGKVSVAVNNNHMLWTHPHTIICSRQLYEAIGLPELYRYSCRFYLPYLMCVNKKWGGWKFWHIYICTL